jgi:DNA (cytosine-5)-methyltransferase 1
MKFLDLFAGIGGFRLGMSMAGHECVGYVEWDKFARKSYEAIHDTKGEWTANDITTIDYREMPRANIWTFGFPCQDISINNNKGQGFQGNRSSLYFEVTKRLRQIKEWDTNRLPSYLLIENVKNFLSVNNGWDFLAAQIELDEIGYDAEWQVVNSSGWVPQSRDRVFIVGHLRGRDTKQVFPLINTSKKNLIKVIDGHQTYRVYSPDGLARTLMGDGGNLNDKAGQYLVKGRIRRLTPRECWRLQGFPDWAFDKASQVNSDSQLYKQAGNSVTVNVIYEIAKRL